MKPKRVKPKLKPKPKPLVSEVRRELRSLRQMFLQPGTWVIVGVLAAFGVVSFFGVRISMRYNEMLYMLGVVDHQCRALTNAHYLVLIAALFLFAFSALYCLGNLFNYLGGKGKKRYGNTQQRLATHAFLGGIGAVVVGAVATGALTYWC